MEKYVFRPYSDEYSILFTQERLKIIEELDPQAHVEHVGSTAVPGLGGKGIIDIAISVSRQDILRTKTQLEMAGYEFREQASSPTRFFFRIDYPYDNSVRRIHVHLTEVDSRDWKEMILFRDYLINNPEAMEQYAELKRRGVDKALGDGQKYREYKEEFIRDILGRVLR